jgi:ubiquinone biosynthesis protein UbiJ
MPATAAWLASAEALLNRCIDASTQAGALARRLQGTSLQINVEGITRVRAAAFGGRLALSADDAAGAAAAISGNAAAAISGNADAAISGAAAAISGADAVISGSVPALLHLLKSGSNRELRRSGAAGRPAQIRGDAEIANLYRELFILARPDPEEELSRWLGDLPARRLSQLAKHALEFARRTRRTAGANIAEYLQEEGRDLVNKTELDEFLRGVDDVRETADRIETRLERLERRLKGIG